MLEDMLTGCFSIVNAETKMNVLFCNKSSMQHELITIVCRFSYRFAIDVSQ